MPLEKNNGRKKMFRTGLQFQRVHGHKQGGYGFKNRKERIKMELGHKTQYLPKLGTFSNKTLLLKGIPPYRTESATRDQVSR